MYHFFTNLFLADDITNLQFVKLRIYFIVMYQIINSNAKFTNL